MIMATMNAMHAGMIFVVVILIPATALVIVIPRGGGLPAARWVPSEVLEEALGLRFVAAGPHGA